jgi:hypothetical protein
VGIDRNEHVWYLAHPIKADDKFSQHENMKDLLRWMKVCFDEGFRVIAPQHTICLVLDDTDLTHRNMGLEIDCTIAQMLGRIIMTGHRVSIGMELEYKAAALHWVGREITSHIKNPKWHINLVGMNEQAAREYLQLVRAQV